MKKTILLAFITSAAPLFGTVFTGTVSGDTYIRGDTGTTTAQNEDTDNEILVGSNGALNNFRSLLRFDVSSIVNDVNTIGGGNFANLTINSASLQVFERRGRANTVNIIANTYNFAFDPATSTWVAPASGDTTAGGTIGTALGAQSVTWDATVDNQDATITLSNSLLATALGSHISNSVHLILTTDTAATNWFSLSSDRAASTTRDAKLTVDYTVTPAGGPILVLDSGTPQPDYTFPYSQITVSPLTRTLRYRNDGTSGSVTVENVTVTNTLGTAFSAGTFSPALPATLAPGQTIDIPIIATSATSGAFSGSVFIDTDITAQDRTEPLTASFYQSGQLFNANVSMLTNNTSWNGGSTWVTPGLLGIAGDGMTRIRGNGDPVQPVVKSALSQAATIPNNLPDWCLDFRFSPVDPARFVDYAGQAPDGSFTDRTFQLVVQTTDTVPAAALTDAIDDNTLINIAYLPDGATTGGVAGFYQFNQGNWQLLDFNGDGSALVLAGSTDVDTDANTANGIGDGILNASSGDTVNAYRMTIQGSAFGTPSATYSITLTGPGGLNKSVSGITGYHNQNPTSALPASFAFITSDTSTQSNAGAGFCPSFWVDEIGYFAVARPAQRLLVFNPPTILRSLNGSSPTTALTLLNDGATAAVSVSEFTAGTSAVTLQSPPSFPLALAAGSQIALTLGLDPDLLVSPDTAATGSISLTSDDPLLAAVSYPYLATKVTDANLIANGDFESATGTGVFPVGWTLTGTPSSISSILPSGGGSAALSLAPSQAILQDFAPLALDGLDDFQADFAFQIGNETQAHRLRLEGDNGGDLVTIRLTTSAVATDSIDVFNAGSFASALSGLTIVPNTTYYLRVIGRDFSQTGREYTIGFSTDGVNYTTSGDMTAFHLTAAARFETATFECGATAGSSLSVENVIIKAAPPDDLAAWLGGFTFAPGADTSATGDADNDGISNLVENVLGTAPNAPTTGLTQITTSSGNLSFEHPVNADPASDVTYTYEWSTDLSEWKGSGQSNTGGVTVNTSPSAPASGVVTVTTTVTGGSTTRVFVRLVANQP